MQAYCRRGDDEARRYALAAGAAGVSSAADLEDAGFDVLLVGEGGAGAGGDLLLAQIAERRGCAMVVEVLEVEEDREGLVVTRDLGRGAREVVRVEGAAVLGVSARAPRRGYVSHYRRQAAGAGEAAAADAAPDAGIGSWEPVRPRPRTGDLGARTGRPASQRMLALLGVAEGGDRGAEQAHLIAADPETCARHLLRYLAHHGFIDRRASRLPDPTEVPERGEGPESSREPARRVAPARSGEPARPGPPPPLHPAGKLSRGPRPVGQESPSRVRGPFGKPSHA